MHNIRVLLSYLIQKGTDFGFLKIGTDLVFTETWKAGTDLV